MVFIMISILGASSLLADDPRKLHKFECGRIARETNEEVQCLNRFTRVQTAVGVDLEELLDGEDLGPNLGSGVVDGRGGVVGVSSAVAKLKSFHCHSSVMAAVVGKQ